MKVRSMQGEDLIAVSQIHQEVFPRQTLSEEWIACNFQAYPRIRFFVAESHGDILGYVQWIEKSGFRKEVVLELEQIAVLSSMQRRGIGTALITESLKTIKEELKQREAFVKHIVVTTRTDNEAQHLYEKILKAKKEAVITNLFSADEVLMISRNPLI